MATQTKPKVPSAWVRFMEAQAVLLRRMDARLLAEHGLTLRDYEVLLRLWQAPGKRLRRVDLSTQVALSQSGVTRLLRGLEDAGYVQRALCASDARVAYAELTDEGATKFRAAARTHTQDIDSLFASHLGDDELDSLADLLGRVLAGQGESGGGVNCA